ncbi:nickel/cobalt transporter [Suttonella ornithocola]|uniref:Nickel/cobalt efflux system n=1 Tax=Suttonella ornithocola TaxID=279832 RepID=A0A380MUI5_9GAMM|nr:hypothetical protein [Suttonella ornithocola]SUO96245.1 nickel/cobalt efflux protein RcnA [Suttonella ornithocola]
MLLKNKFVILLLVLFGFTTLVWLTRDYWLALIYQLQQTQNAYQRQISQALASLRHQNNSSLQWSLMGIAWLYGFLHAIGPGHGKAVLTTWLLTQPEHYRHTLLIGIGGAFLQAISAFFWVGVSIGVGGYLIRESMAQSIWLNRLSFLFIICIGLYLIYRAFPRKQFSHCQCGHHKHSHHHKPAIVAAIGIGIRPCSGALLILSVAAAWGLWETGALMVFAMAMGTATTLSIIALLLILGRKPLLMRFSQQNPSRFYYWLPLFGGFLITLLGIFLLISTFSLSATKHPILH